MKYIDAEELKNILSNRYTEITVPIITDEGGIESYYRRSELHHIIKLIDSLQQEQGIIVLNKKDWEKQEQFRKDKKFGIPLQQEQSEVDFENKLDEWMKYGPHTCYPWCSVPDAIEITARHFYEFGLNARKEE